MDRTGSNWFVDSVNSITIIQERAVMIRKLEHERDKLSNQLEKSQEAASHAKKMAKEGEMAIKSATANCTRLENELNRLAQARF